MTRALMVSGRMSWVLSQQWPVDDWMKCGCTDDTDCDGAWFLEQFAGRADLLVTVGFRHLVPDSILASVPLGVIGFHSAKLPQYPGRAPVPWAILRGDPTTENTMLFLTSEPDAGDIIDRRTIPVTTASEMNRRMGETAAEMLRQHLPALLVGRAVRQPQDRSLRGPLTTAAGWRHLSGYQR